VCDPCTLQGMPNALPLLLIDDDATTRELLSLLLSNAGWAVTVAEDGSDALAALRNGEAPAVILSDLQMPGLCGTPLAQAIRTVAPSAILLAMTATRLAVVPEGYDALLVKPFAPEALEQHYNAVLSRSTVSLPADLPMEDQAAVFDPTVLDQLRKSMPPERLTALLTFVADDADTRITRMGVAASEGDDATYRKEAHALKGSCGMVGALHLRQLAACAEDEGLSKGPLTEWNIAADFVAATATIRLMLETLSPVVVPEYAGEDQRLDITPEPTLEE
jgi:DNA-binding response OmpR family regulator